MFERIIYVSRAAPRMGQREVFDIIRVAHNRNSQHGLTGALILLDGYFLQVLEGDPWHLQCRYQSILKDPRHTHIELRQRVAITAPSFADEWMALRHDDLVAPALRERFDYAPGFPAQHMDASRLLAFAQACLEAPLVEA